MILQNTLFTQEIPQPGAAKGHVRFTTQSTEAEDIALIGFCANLAASVLFERLHAQGTNLVFNLAKDEATVDVLARYEDDGLNLLWTPKAGGDLSSIQERIRNKTFFIGRKKEEPKPVHLVPPVPLLPGQDTIPPPPQPDAKSNPADKENMSEEEEDYQVKQLMRIP
jgi:hypothetical protein